MGYERNFGDNALQFVRERFATRKPHRKDIRNKDLLVRGEQTSATLSAERAEMIWPSVETATASVSGQTNEGGPNSKYSGKNEDSILLQADGARLRVGVIDGAGGSENGRNASILANAVFMEGGRKFPGHLAEDTSEATKIIQEQSPESYAAGVIVEIMDDDSVNIVSVGDSKAMTIRKGSKLPEGTTKMQNRVQALIDNGIVKPWDYYTHEENNIITSALGHAKNSKPESISFRGEEGDQIILASDGVWDVVTEYEVLWFAKHFRGKELQDKIFELAYARNNTEQPFKIRFDEKREIDMEPLGGGDNISIIVVEKKEQKPALAVGDYCKIELPDGAIDYNWRIAGPVDHENMVPANKIVNGQKATARVPLEQLVELNPDGSIKEISFDGVITVQDLFSTLDLAGFVQGSQKSYSAQELKTRFNQIAAAKDHGNESEMRKQLEYVTNGQEGQNLRDAFERLIAL